MFNLVAGSVISGSANMMCDIVRRFPGQLNEDGIWELDKTLIAAGIGAVANIASEYFVRESSKDWNDGGPSFAAFGATIGYIVADRVAHGFTDKKSYTYLASAVTSFVVSTGVHVFVKNNFSQES